MNDKEKFESKFIVAHNDCWNWCGCLDSQGYGAFRYTTKTVKAHRFSYELYVGQIPKGLGVLHKCNNCKCVNPNHLYAGTQYDNVQDAIEAGTFVVYGGRGENHPQAKLNNDDVICIKKMLQDGIKQWLIAWIYQVTRGKISCIYTGKSWSHIRI